MRLLLTGEQMKQADKVTIGEYGVPSAVLMERAALAAVQELESEAFCLSRLLIVCGTGNNGGDGIAMARILLARGISADVVLIGEEENCTPETREQIRIYKNYGGSLASRISCSEYTTIVDALFGVGLTRNVEGIYREAVDQINSMSGRVLAVDIPSGINSNNGRIMGAAVQADVTVTFAYEKLGTVLYPGHSCAGRVKAADIGITDASLKGIQPMVTYDEEDWNRVPERPAYSNKGTFGKLLMIAGTTGMSGAACLAAEAAYRTGAGLVRVFTPEENRLVLQTVLPEAVVTCYDRSKVMRACEQLITCLRWADVVVIGSGAGTGPEMKAFLQTVLRTADGPVVIDADGLNLLAMDPGMLQEKKGPVIVTPHIGEMSRLTGRSIADIQQDLIQTAELFAQKHGVVCVLKDARTIVADQTGLFINTNGNSGMATGGSGDVLSGVIGGLLGAGMTAEAAARLGVYIHSYAGDKAAAAEGPYRMLAGDMLKQLMIQ